MNQEKTFVFQGYEADWENGEVDFHYAINYSAAELRSIPSDKFVLGHSSSQQAASYSDLKINYSAAELRSIRQAKSSFISHPRSKLRGIQSKIKSANEILEFTEKISFLKTDISQIPKGLLKNLLDNLLLMLGISYWKLYCSKTIVIENNWLTKEETKFWNTVYTKGLGEFFYKNKIDFRGLVEFPYQEKDNNNRHSGEQSESRIKTGNRFWTSQNDEIAINFPRKEQSLLLLGGGKDSLVSAELLKRHKKPFAAFIVNKHPIQDELVKLMDVDYLVVHREIDPKLLSFNKNKNTYNGHVPISAIYAFLGLFAACMFDYRYVIASNEESANYGNVSYLGEEINHQWSKSLEFEQLFSKYVRRFITPSVTYFSLLRPFKEIAIAKLFSKHTKYFSSFSSCNRNFKNTAETDGNRWCGQCPKCAFVFAILAAFLPKPQIAGILKNNLYADPSLHLLYQALLGLEKIKPFECVGTPDETRLAMYLAFQRGDFNNDAIMKMFIKEVLPTITNPTELKTKEFFVGKVGNIPAPFTQVIKAYGD